MIELTQGDSLDLEFRTDDRRDLTDFTCQLQVRDSSDVITTIDRAIITRNSTNTSYIARLTPTESNSLTVGDTYKLSAQLANSTTNESLELSDDLLILKQYNY